MAITWDAPLAAAVAGELDATLGGDRVRSILLDKTAHAFALFTRTHTLVAKLHRDDGRMWIETPSDPPVTARSLSSVIESVESPPDDRIILLRLRKARGARAPVLIAVELITGHWNVVVAQGPEVHIDHLLRPGSTGRGLAKGSPYLPPASEREGIAGDLSLERWLALLEPVAASSRRSTLLSRIAWTSPLNAGALLGAAMRSDGPDATQALVEGHGIWTRVWQSIREPTPVVLLGGEVPQPYPLELPGLETRVVPSLLDGFTLDQGVPSPSLQVPSFWIEALERRAETAHRRVESLERELRDAPDPGALRAIGDLLLARLPEIPRGTPRLTLVGFDGTPTDIEMDPSLDPPSNAARYYDRAARAERALARLPSILESARHKSLSYSQLLSRVESGEAGLDELRAALGEVRGASGEMVATESLPYRRYSSSGGIEIRVGRGARRNDDLTFHHARPDDVWLHARHASGAHVVLRWNGADAPPARDLEEAATLAALHSTARTSSTVPVDWTRRKYVRKPRKSAPGSVVPDRVKTVFVEPDPELEARLRTE